VRDGTPVQVPAAELVRGDVVALAAGDKVSADLRVVCATELAVDESALTGESVPVAKQSGAFGEAVLGDCPHTARSPRRPRR
jgi:cation-transporting P-type ATPase F